MNLRINGLIDWTRKHYDRALAVAAVAALVGSLIALFIQFGSERQRMIEFERWMRNLRPAREHVDLVTNTAYVAVQEAIARPAQLATGENRERWFFVPESRFSCAECGHPVPVDSEDCPFCGALVTPPEPDTIDHDSDGMPTPWENEYGLNPNDPSDAHEDLDGDGFTNLEEFRYSTDPRDAKSHPPLIDWLIVDDIQGQRFGLQFRSRIRTRDGNYRFGINYRLPDGDTKTDFVDLGGSVSGFVIESYEEKPDVDNRDVSELTIRSPRGDKIVLVKDQPVLHVELTAKLRMGREAPSHEFLVRPEEPFTFDGVTYRVIEIDAKNRDVIVQAQPDGSRYTITSNVRREHAEGPLMGGEPLQATEPVDNQQVPESENAEVTDLFREMMR